MVKRGFSKGVSNGRLYRRSGLVDGWKVRSHRQGLGSGRNSPDGESGVEGVQVDKYGNMVFSESQSSRVDDGVLQEPVAHLLNQRGPAVLLKYP